MATSIATPTAGGVDTAPITAPSGGGGGSAMDLLDSVLDSPSEAAPAQADTSGDDAVDPAIAKAEQEATPEEDPFSLDKIFDADEDAEPEQVEQDGRNAYKMSQSRMQAFVAAKKLADGIRDFAPSVDAARQHYQRASDFDTMEADFRSPLEVVEDGNGNQVTAARSFLDYWNGVSPEGIGAVAGELPRYLAEQGHTQALQQVESTVLQANINRLYNRAARSGNPEDLVRAQNADFALTGRFRESVQPIQQQAHQQNPAQDIEARLDRIVQREWNAFDTQNLSGSKTNALQSQVDQLFGKDEVTKGFSEPVLQALRNQTIKEVQDKIDTDAEWKRNHEIAARSIRNEYQKAVRDNKPTNDLTGKAQALVNDYAARVRRHLFAVAKPLLQSATQNTVSSNRQTHQRLQASASKTAPSGGGRPVQRSIAQIPPNLKGQDLIEWSLNN